MTKTPLLRGIMIVLGAWAFAAALGTAHQIAHFKMGFGASVASSIFLPLLGALLGPFVGLLSGAPYFTWQFKLCLAAALSLAAGLVVIGVRGEASWWRWLLGGGGALLWIVAGLLGLGPQ